MEPVSKICDDCDCSLHIYNRCRGCHGRDPMHLQQPMQLVPISDEVVSSNQAQVRCTRYSIM
jgi:hypothetical protein